MSLSIDEEWVDLFSNKSFIQNLRPDSLINILLGQRFPKEISLSLLHEATHHWCFSSQLGNALFYIKMRAYWILLQNAETQDWNEVKWDIYSAYTRYYTIKRLFDPLSEGLALFAEYDVYSTKTEAVPAYLVFMSIAFSGFKVGEYLDQSQDTFDDAYNAFLYERRILSRDGQDRKAGLLIKPASISKSPYLTGYLFVKNLQGFLMANVDKKFKDPNIFLQFIKAYYFEDAGFIKMIMDDDISEEDIVPEYLDYFNRRTAQIIRFPDGTAETFAAAIVNPDPHDLYTIISNPGNAVTIKKELETKLTELFEAYRPAYHICIMRNYFKVTRLKCYVKVTGHNIITYVRMPYSEELEKKSASLLKSGAAIKRDGYIDVFAYSMPNLEKQEPFEGEAYFEKYISFSPEPKAFDVLLTQKGPIFPITLAGFSQLPPDERAIIHEHFHQVDPHLDIFEMDTVLKNLWKDDTTIEFIEAFNEEKNIERIERYYEELAIGCPDSMLERVRALMSDAGFWKILDEREDLVDLLSLLSLITSLINSGDFPPLKELLDLIAEEHGAENINELAEKLGRFGLNLLIPTKWIMMTMGI